ncbi:MAG: hypothetical protein RLZZ595_606 [Bacteroidota bacterium]
MSETNVRVRFAPSPTGGLHLGGVRTALYNYLFARKHNGTFILRIEDTDQTRFVPGAEQYIIDCLKWCGISPDEGPHISTGNYGPYRQSERKSIYGIHAELLVKKGFAYYAFDTPADLEMMRDKYKSSTNPSPQYDHHVRMEMRNSLSLPVEEVDQLLAKQTHHVIRIKMPRDQEVELQDMIRGKVVFNTNQLDDKVLLKADGMPTYHLAVVVDDYEMKISHAFRGEEWLPSAPIHILLWEYLGWKDSMPNWAHLPLILKPDGKGKLSKRDGDQLGFPVFAMDWLDPKTGERTKGFKELGFLPEAFINLLAMIGWNDGSGAEIFELQELVTRFEIDRVHKAGAKFDYEKAKWFNHEWIKKINSADLIPVVKPFLSAEINSAGDEKIEQALSMVKDRCSLLCDVESQLSFLFMDPSVTDWETLKSKWDEQKEQFFLKWTEDLNSIDWSVLEIEKSFKENANTMSLKPGELQLPFRLMLVGGKFGPSVMEIANFIGKEATLRRITQAIEHLKS